MLDEFWEGVKSQMMGASGDEYSQYWVCIYENTGSRGKTIEKFVCHVPEVKQFDYFNINEGGSWIIVEG